MIGVLVVVFRPRLHEIDAALAAIAAARAAGVPLAVHLWHNDGGAAATAGLAEACRRHRDGGLPIRVAGGTANLGFGRGINALAAAADEPFWLVLNQDAVPEPGALERLWAAARQDAAEVAAWELRQIPYEHPKDYDPLTRETGWCSGAAVLLRAAAFRAVGGFEPRIFMYGEDVDLSWRLRAAGWRLTYRPDCAVVHRTYAHAGEIKPLQALGGNFANLCLRTRFGTAEQVWEMLRTLLRQLRAPEAFPGHRAGLARMLLKYLRHAAHFRRTRVTGPGFQPCFAGWDYEARRAGAFHPFLAQSEQVRPRPMVAMIVCAHAGAGGLRRLLLALQRQTHRPLELIVLGPADEAVDSVCDAARAGLPVHRVPRPADRAGLAMALGLSAAGWFGLIDADRHLPYADHVEVLLQAAEAPGGDGATALGWEIEAYFRDDPVPGRFQIALGAAAATRPAGSVPLVRRRRLQAALDRTGADEPPCRTSGWAARIGADGLATADKLTVILSGCEA